LLVIVSDYAVTALDEVVAQREVDGAGQVRKVDGNLDLTLKPFTPTQ